MFLKLGDIISDCMLVQVESGKGMMIDLYDGNRYSDRPISLVHKVPSDIMSAYGTWLVNIPKSITAYGMRRQTMTLANQTPPKPDTISFIRYVRPLLQLSRVGYQLESKKGLTFLIQLDYVQRTIKFQYSICNGDNFSKKIGVQKAVDRTEKLNGYHQLDIPENGIPENGTVQYIINSIASDGLGLTKNLSIPQKDMEMIISFYAMAFE